MIWPRYEEYNLDTTKSDLDIKVCDLNTKVPKNDQDIKKQKKTNDLGTKV